MRALADSPQILLVDEGLAGTDSELKGLMVDVLLQYGKEHAVLLISHDTHVLLRTERLLLLAHGTIQAEGVPRELLPNLQGSWPQ